MCYATVMSSQRDPESIKRSLCRGIEEERNSANVYVIRRLIVRS